MNDTETNFLHVKYKNLPDKIIKGKVSFSESTLIFSNDHFNLKIDKEDISSFKITKNIFIKKISIRVNGKNHTFYLKNKDINRMLNFIKE